MINRYKILIILILLSFNGNAQQYFIQLNGGEIRKFSSIEVVQKKYEKPYFKVEDNQMFRTEQVEAFQNKNGFFIKNDLTVSKRDFAKRVMKGRIDVFNYDLSSNYIQTGQGNLREYFAYMKNGVPLKQMIYVNLIKDLKDNPESMKILNKIKAAKRISPLYYVLGGASIVAAGILFNTSKNNATTPLFLVGVGFFSIPWILNSKRQKRMNDAIKIYNQ